MPEFSRAALEALREPLETGQIRISRAAAQTEFPAHFQLVAAMNPCPCGHLGHGVVACRCTPDQIRRYQGKISGPLLDRLDLHIEVPALSTEALMQTAPGEASAVVRERVVRARALAVERQGVANRALQAQALDTHTQLSAASAQWWHKAIGRLGWSARSTHRCLRVARTVADLAGSVAVEVPHLAEAMQYRRALAA